MKKEDQNQNRSRPVQFSDADYQQDMRYDPLTTGQRIREEIGDMVAAANQRAAKAAEVEAGKAENDEEDDKQSSETSEEDDEE